MDAGLSPVPRRWSEGARGAALLSPALVYSALLLAVPIVAVLVLSFVVPGEEEGTYVATLENYRTAWTDSLYLELFLRSVLISVASAVATVVLAYPMAYFMAFHAGRWRHVWMLLVTIPFWTSYLLRVLAWKIALGQNGAINTSLIQLGLIDEPFESLLYNVQAVLIVLAHTWAVYAILPIYVSLTRIDPSLLEAATDLGDGPLRSFLRVTLPLSIPGVIAALLIVMIPTVGDYVTPKLVGGKDGVMIANAIQVQFGKAANWPLGAALSVTTMVIVTMMALASVFIIRSAARMAR